MVREVLLHMRDTSAHYIANFDKLVQKLRNFVTVNRQVPVVRSSANSLYTEFMHRYRDPNEKTRSVFDRI